MQQIIAETEGVALFPNPGNNEFYIRLDSDSNVIPYSIDIFDVLGKKVSNTSGIGGGVVFMSTEQFISGNYQIQIGLGQTKYNFKWVKI